MSKFIKKSNINLKEGSIPETMFIPLYARAKETVIKGAVISDTKAVEIIERIELDFKRFSGGNITHHAIIARTWTIDEGTRKFLLKNPDGIIINLGSGLDTRMARVDNGQVYWYDLDLPEGIELRRKFFMESDRNKFIAKSIMDFSWLKDVKTKKDTPVLIIAEGILMYFTEIELKEIFGKLIAFFPEAEMYLSVVHKHLIGKGITANFTWGINNENEITNLHSNIRLLENWSVGDLFKDKQSLFLRIMNIMPMFRKRSQVLRIKFVNE